VRVVLLLPGVLREHADGQDEVRLDLPEGARAEALVNAVSRRWPALGRRLREDTGMLRRHVNLFVDGEDVRALAGPRTRLTDGTVVHVLPSVAGG
jgi:molybdopterin synthase sulfur carrier subunit